MEQVLDIISKAACLIFFGSLFYLVYAMNKQDKQFAEFEKSHKNS